MQDSATWANLTTGAWCYYENQTANGTTYGKLYNWYAMNDPRGIAPEGWHIPTEREWMNMVDSLGSNFNVGGKLKTTTLWNSPNVGATNSIGFNALPGGLRNANGKFDFKGFSARWWTSTLLTQPTFGSLIFLTNDSEEVYGPSENEKRTGCSLRLIWNY